jgi:hypothetical protein
MKTALLSLTLLAAAAQAQQVEIHQRMAQLDPAFEMIDHPALMQLAGRELAGEPVVKGAPYCATTVHERIQPLVDGNRIVQRQTGLVCRDGEGRTRREVQREGGKRVVYLHDPTTQESWVIDGDGKTRRQLKTQLRIEHGGDGARSEEFAARMRDWAQDMARRFRDGRPADAPHAPEPPKPGEPRTETRIETRVIRLADGAAPSAPLPPLPPGPPTGAPAPLPPMPPLPPIALSIDLTPRGPGATTALPASEIEGIKVNGERTTWTIEAGKIGNEKPILISREVWKSPELMITVSRREADPRSGEVNYRLERIKRGEPDAALMKPPAKPEGKA